MDKCNEPLLTAEELATALRVKPKTILDWAKRYDEFPHFTLPGSTRFKLSEVMDWLKEFERTEKTRKEVK